MAFGDHLNDNTMLEWAGWGVAMANAVQVPHSFNSVSPQPLGHLQETKACAEELTTSNDEDGVARVLEELTCQP